MSLQFIYFADPMCSWCWGFSPVVSNLIEKFGSSVPIHLVMGGLYTGTRDPLTESGKKTMRDHWNHVHEASGQPFDHAFFETKGFIYNTEGPCRAVVTARRLSPARAMAFLATLHEAFYAHNRDITDQEVIFDVAEEFGFSRNIFREEFESTETNAETQSDFSLAQRTGITGFPALLARNEERVNVVSLGYQPWERIELAVGHLLEQL